MNCVNTRMHGVTIKKRFKKSLRSSFALQSEFRSRTNSDYSDKYRTKYGSETKPVQIIWTALKEELWMVRHMQSLSRDHFRHRGNKTQFYLHNGWCNCTITFDRIPFMKCWLSLHQRLSTVGIFTTRRSVKRRKCVCVRVFRTVTQTQLEMAHKFLIAFICRCLSQNGIGTATLTFRHRASSI